MKQLFLLLFVSLLIMGCGQTAEKQTQTHEQEQSEDTAQEEYRPPDGGFGTIDGSKEAREEAEQSGKEAEEALKKID